MDYMDYYMDFVGYYMDYMDYNPLTKWGPHIQTSMDHGQICQMDRLWGKPGTAKIGPYQCSAC